MIKVLRFLTFKLYHRHFYVKSNFTYAAYLLSPSTDMNDYQKFFAIIVIISIKLYVITLIIIPLVLLYNLHFVVD